MTCPYLYDPRHECANDCPPMTDREALATPCPVCGEKNGNRHATTLSIVKIERVNPARYTYGALVDRAAVDAHLRALGVIA